MNRDISLSSPPLRGLKNLWILIGVGVLATVTMSVYQLWSGYRDALANAETTRRNLAWVLEGHLDASLRRTDTVLNALAVTLPHEALQPVRVSAYRHVIDRELDLRLGDFPEVTALRIWSAAGDLLYTSGEMPRTSPNISDRDYFRILEKDPAAGRMFGEVIASRITGARGFVVCYPLRDATGRFLGVVTALINLGYFESLFESLSLGRNGIVAIRRTDDHKLVMRWPPVPAEINQPLRPGHPNRELIASGVKSGVVEHVTQAAGIRRLINMQRLEKYPFYILVGQTRETVLADWNRRLEITLLMSFCMLYVLIWMVGRLWSTERHRQATDAQVKLLASVFEHSGEAILISDAGNRIIEVNPAFTQITGYAADAVRGKDPGMLSSGRTTPEEYAVMWRSIIDDGFWQGEIWDRHRDGHVYPKWLTISTIRAATGQISHYIASFTDITARKAAEERIHYLAHHDALTRLPNRTHLQGRLEQAIMTARRDDGRLAVLFIDMDHFKKINDSLGHHVGDGMLIEVAERLRQSVRESDVVARLGGDEFVVVLTDIARDTVPTLVGKVLKNLSRTYVIDDHELHSTPSIGISLFPEDGADVDALMKNADTAMYHAKAAGRNNYQFFTSAMNVAATERVLLEGSLRQALERGEFVLHYQPQIDVASGRPCGVEALVRWQHPEHGMISPLKFIPIAEESGLIVQLGEWVLDTALDDLARWRAAGIDGLRMAVNLSAHQLRDPQLVPLVAALLALHDLQGSDLELEITESVAMKNPEGTIRLLTQLRNLGIELAIDDFGTGYSSLAYLKLLPLDRLKLDRSFVMDIEHDPNDAAICAATISLAHSLGLSVVGEGVETVSQFEFLKKLDCDVVQGFFFSRPLPAAEAEAFLRRT
jgi:diguanylate cyclase (GGDEF)-like protein/PAS domain S-box-containing protein